MFVLDFVPENYLKGGEKNSVAVFTAGWAMKFVPLLGRALKDMVLSGKSDYALPEFSMTRKDETTGKGIIVDSKADTGAVDTSLTSLTTEAPPQAKGSSIRSAQSRI